MGRKNKAQFRIVVQEHKLAPTGKHVEIVGSWDPHQKKGTFQADRIKYWLEQGAKASDSVHNLLISQKVIDGEKRAIKISKKKSKDGEGEEKAEEKAEVKAEENKADDKAEAGAKEKSDDKADDGEKKDEKEEKKE